MAPPRTLHIRCGTWDQVEAFYSRKLRRGRLLSMRVPFAPAVGSELIIGLELPSHQVLSIDGAVRKCEPSEGDSRHWIEIELVGLSDELLRGLREQVASGGASAVSDSDLTPVPASLTSLEPAPTVLGRPSVPRSEAPAGPAASASPSSPSPPARPASTSRPPSPSPSPSRSASPSTASSTASSTAPSSAPSSASSAMSSAARRDAGPLQRTPLAPPVSEDTVPRSPRLEDARPPRITAPLPFTGEEDLPGDERELFAALSSELRRLRQGAVHEVLGVSRDARAEEIRAGWMAHIRRFHPDVMARHRSDAVSHLAEELTILGNRAYDRLRVALVAEGRGAAFGPALFTPHGWLVGFEDLSTSDVPAARVLAARPLAPTPVALAMGAGSASARASSSPSSASGFGPTPTNIGDHGFEHLPSAAASRTGESFEAQARELLSAGDAGGAREVLATALVVYPRSRPLRSLYYVASALTALAAGQLVLATSQLETALAHHEGCVEASLVLDQIHKNGGTDYDALRRLFQ